MRRVIHSVDQRGEEWFALRAGRLTASDAAVVLTQPRKGQSESVTRHKLIVQLALGRVTGRCDVSGVDTPAMQRGRELEADGLAAYEAKTGTLLDRVGFVSCDEMLIGCSPDGAILDGSTFAGGVEMKCPEVHTHLGYLKDPHKLLDAYQAQCMHTLLVTDAPWWDLASYCPSFPGAACLLVVRVLRSGPLNHFIAEVPPFAQAVDVVAYELLVRAFLKEVDAEVTEIRRIAGLDDQEAA